MKKSAISRRNFVRGIAAGALSTTVIPVWADEQSFFINQTPQPLQPKEDQSSLPPFFDCNKYIGPGFPKRPDYPHAADLLAHMDRLGIEKAVAFHTGARDLHPMDGNENLLLEIKTYHAHDRIIPSFVIAPSIITGKNTMNRFLNLVRTNSIRAFHFFPGKAGLKLQDIAPVIKTIQTLKPVLFLDAFENLGKDTESISKFAVDFPQVSIVFTNAMWGHLASIYELMKKHSNVFIDTSLLHVYRAIEQIIKLFGVSRIIFGTGYKSNNGASIASIAHADLTPEQTQLIFHGNIEKLLGIKSPLSGTKPIEGDRLWHRLLRHESLGPDYIDAHTHLCRTTADWTDHDKVKIEEHAKQAIRQMDHLGVHSMVIAEYTVYPPDLSMGKTFMEEHLSPFGDRFHGYFSGLAFKTDKTGKLTARLDDLFSRPYYVGFKMHNAHWNIPVTDPDFIPLWEYADKHRLPILLHTWNDNVDAPKMLTEIVPRYPNATFIMGHSGNTDRPDAEKLAQDNPNVFLEWCGSFIDPTDWRETMETLGNRRILYGSDFISWESQWGHDAAWEMGRLLSMDVPDETLLPILGSNMRGILRKRI